MSLKKSFVFRSSNKIDKGHIAHLSNTGNKSNQRVAEFGFNETTFSLILTNGYQFTVSIYFFS